LEDKTVLVIAAHMDDEVLSNTRYIQSRVAAGCRVLVHIPYGRRYVGLHEDEAYTEQYACLLEAKKLLGYSDINCTNYTEGEPTTVGYYRLLNDLEVYFAKYNITELVIPSKNDTNQDHRFLNDVCTILTRPINRGSLNLIIESMTYDSQLVEPNYYIPMSCDDMLLKINAILCYSSETRKHPHVRSIDNIKSMHSIWGSKSNCDYAEAYTVRMIKE
jgi:hypothetical protein